MTKKSLFLPLLLLLHGLMAGQVVNRSPLSPRITTYLMDVSLDTQSKTVSGSMQASWVNISSDTVPDIMLHLYMNAFSNVSSTFNKEFYKAFGRTFSITETEMGSIEIESFSDGFGSDLLPLITYMSPDDGNPDDKTVVRIILPQPALPGDTVLVNIGFKTKLPGTMRRTGYNDDFFFIAQWFPKFGVYEPAGMRNSQKGSWNCHQFHFDSEFYSNHSLYEVNIDVPSDYIVGSGGLLISESQSADGRKSLRYRAEDIVDFAWTAWPGYKVFTEQWNHVTITLLTGNDAPAKVSRQFTAVRNALEYLTMHVGPYPWPHLTLVEPPPKGSGSGGMEYTTLFTSESSFMVPSWMHMPELVTVHEFGHAYFMGIIANNEAEESWMDEGINSFWEGRIMSEYYGEESGLIDHPLLHVPDIAAARISYINSPARQAASNSEFSWTYPHRSYYMMSYYKPVLWLNTLMGLTGEETVTEIFREYYKRWAFKHPTATDFVDVVNDVVRKRHGDEFGPDMNWFFEQTLYGTGICDYKVTGIINRKQDETLPDAYPVSQSSPKSEVGQEIFESVVELERVGEIILPVEILVHFSDGTEIIEKWDGKSRTMDLSYKGPRKIEWAKIDPGYKNLMDVSLLNNSLSISQDNLPVRRIAYKLISLFQFLFSFIFL